MAIDAVRDIVPWKGPGCNAWAAAPLDKRILTHIINDEEIWPSLLKRGLFKKGVYHVTLDELAIGQSAVVASVGGEGALRRRLLDMGITPKTTVMMRKKAPMGDPVEICLRGYELTLRLEDARKIELRGEEGQ